MNKFEALRGLVPPHTEVTPPSVNRTISTDTNTEVRAQITRLKACALPPNHSSRDMGVRLNVSPTNRPRRGNAR